MNANQVVAFKLAEEEYAVDILSVQEIIRPVAVTRVPKAPEYITGVINLRGNVVPVINLRKRFNIIEETEINNSNRVIILNVNEIKAGIMVDNVTEVITLEKENIEETNFIDNLDNKFVFGVGKYENRLLILLDLAETLDLAHFLTENNGM